MKELYIFFERNPHCVDVFRDSLLAIALCQGAALHYYNKTNGIKDFDVWYFFSENGNRKFNPRWRHEADSTLSKFGKHPDHSPHFLGRKLDLLGRTIPSREGSPEECIKAYLTQKRIKSAFLLSQKAVVGLYPDNILGLVIWP